MKILIAIPSYTGDISKVEESINTVKTYAHDEIKLAIIEKTSIVTARNEIMKIAYE